MNDINQFSFAVSKFLIITGERKYYDFVTKSEILDLSVSGNYQCPDWIDYPISVSQTTGGLLGKNPVVCGGHPVDDQCYSITSNAVDFLGHLQTARNGAASVTINSSVLWITGGGTPSKASSEFVLFDGSILTGPDLPTENKAQCPKLESNELSNPKKKTTAGWY